MKKMIKKSIVMIAILAFCVSVTPNKDMSAKTNLKISVSAKCSKTINKSKKKKKINPKKQNRKSTDSRIKASVDKFNSDIQRIADDVNTKATEVEKIVYLHDLICDMTEYEFMWAPQNILNTGKGCCVAYASLFSMIANKVGIVSKVVGSNTHAWNIVKLNGKWYHLDACWDDDPQYPNKQFFLVSPDKMAELDTSEAHTLSFYYSRLCRDLYWGDNSDYEYLQESREERQRRWFYETYGECFENNSCKQ